MIRASFPDLPVESGCYGYGDCDCRQSDSHPSNNQTSEDEMNAKRAIRSSVYVAFLIAITVLSHAPAAPQTQPPDDRGRSASLVEVVNTSRISSVYGESVESLPVNNRSVLELLSVTNRDLYTLPNPDSVAQASWRYRRIQRPSDPEDRISCITSLRGETGDVSTKYLMWQSGEVEKIEILRDASVTSNFLARLPLASSETPVHIAAMVTPPGYSANVISVLTSSRLFRSTDDGQQWGVVDDTGLPGGTKNYFSHHYPSTYILAHSNGLYLRNMFGTSWSPVPYFGTRTMHQVYVDRLNRIFVPDGNKLLTSTNNTFSWTAIDSGKGFIPNLTIWGDDDKNNIYASDGYNAWKFADGTGASVRIDHHLTDKFYDSFPSSPVINSIGGESHVYIGSKFGSFRLQPDTTWEDLIDGIKSRHFNGMIEFPSGKQMVSNNLGLVARVSKFDSIFVKAWPPKYVPYPPLFGDKSGNAYTLGLRLDPFNSQSLRINFKSTDAGVTFTPDTAGLSAIGAGTSQLYSVTADGTQWYAGVGFACLLNSKLSGNPWVPEYDGIGNLPTYAPFALGSAGNRYYFAAYDMSTYQGAVWSRGKSETQWETDTIGIGRYNVSTFSSMRDGSPLAGTYYAGLWRYGPFPFKQGVQSASAAKTSAAGAWTWIPSPPGLENASVFTASVDSGGAIIAAFTGFTGTGFVGRGVYVTLDTGATWIAAGLDSIFIRKLSSYGTTTYVSTFDRGLFKIERGTATSVEISSAEPAAFGLDQNYPNPFNPATRIGYHFSGPGPTWVKLVVFDLLGRELVTLVNELKLPGAYSVPFEGSNLSSGAYFYRLQAGNTVLTRKLVLLR